MLANKAITRIRDFTYLESNVSEDGGTYKDVETRIQKARGAFTRLRKIWIAHYVNKDIKIKQFNVYVKSVLLYGCQTWLVTCEIQRKIQSFVNRCLRYIMKIWWPRVISNEKPREMTGQININKEIRKRKFGWIGHESEPCKVALQWNTHKVQEEGVGQEIHGDERHLMKVGSTAGVISGLSPGTEKVGEDL
jgi:hypothetical protein